MTLFRICNKVSGADLGFFSGRTAAEAFAALCTEGGATVKYDADSDTVHFASREDARLCNQGELWIHEREIEVDLKGPLAPRVVYDRDVPAELVDAALPAGWRADYSSAVTTRFEQYAVPLVRDEDAPAGGGEVEGVERVITGDVIP